jgi:translocation and assembly module TamB
VERLEAQLAGGQLQGTAQADVISDAIATQVTNWQGALQASNIQPSLLWSELAAGALGGELSAQAVEGNAQAVDIQARIQPAATQPRTKTGSATTDGSQPLSELRLEELRLQGRWTPAAGTPTQGVLDLQAARLALAGATLTAQGQLDTAALTYTGQIDARLPGLSAQIKGELAHAQGNGTTNVQLSDAARGLAWLREMQTLPFVGPPLKAFLDTQPGLAATGSARMEARWQGGLGALGYPAPAATPATTPAPSPRLQASLIVPRLEVQTDAAGPATISDLTLQAEGGLNNLQLELDGTATQAPWRAALQSSGQLTQTNDSWQNGLLALSRLQLRVDQPEQTSAASSWTLQAEQPIRLQWENDAQGLALNAGSGELKVRPDNAVPRNGNGTGTTATPTLAWENLTWRAGALQTKGQVRGLPLSWVDSLTTVEGGGLPPLRAAGLGGDLMFDGLWDVLLPSDAAQPLRLNASLQRTSGDLLLLSDRAVAMAALHAPMRTKPAAQAPMAVPPSPSPPPTDRMAASPWRPACAKRASTSGWKVVPYGPACAGTARNWAKPAQTSPPNSLHPPLPARLQWKAPWNAGGPPARR